MPTRASRHGADWVWFGLGLIAAGLLLFAAVTIGLQVVLGLMAIPAALAALYLLWKVDPAYTFCAGFFLSPIAGNWQALGFPTGVDPDRILLSFAILQVLFRAPAVRNRPRFILVPAHFLLGLALAYVVVSAHFAGTLFVKDPTFKIIDAFGLLPFLTFLTAPLAFRTPYHRRVLLVTFVVMGAWLGLTVLFETVHLNALIFPRYILNPHYGIHVGRGRGPFVDAVANGFALFVCAAVCVVAINTWSQLKYRVLAGAIAILCFAGAYMSLERSVWLGATAGSVITMLTIRKLRPYFIPVAMIGVLAVLAALAFIPGLRAEATKRADMIGTIHDRENLSVAGFNMIRARPLTGFGWQKFQADSRLYFRQSPNYPLTATKLGIHNFLLSYAVDLGLPGVTLWALGLLAGIASAMLARGPPDIDPWRAALLATAVAFAVIANSVPPSLFPNLSLWLLAAVGFSGRYDPERLRRATEARRRTFEAAMKARAHAGAAGVPVPSKSLDAQLHQALPAGPPPAEPLA